MNQITYLLGAGASAPAVPPVDGFGKGLETFRSRIYNTFKNSGQVYIEGKPISSSSFVNAINEDFKWAMDEIGSHKSVDTYARKLYLSGDLQNYRKLKGLIDYFLLGHQTVIGIEKRYDAFWATIMRGSPGKIDLPKNMLILSWNYDNQLELSAAQFYTSMEFKDVELKLNIHTPEKNAIKNNRFTIIKLNGSAGFHSKNSNGNFKRSYEYIPRKIGPLLDEGQANDLLGVYSKLYYSKYFQETSYSPGIHYAWENLEIPKQTRRTAVSCSEQTKILVIIGYSFPTYNRKIDEELIVRMKKLDRIYVQVLEKDWLGIKQRIEAILNKKGGSLKPELIPGTDEFFIPFQFDG